MVHTTMDVVGQFFVSLCYAFPSTAPAKNCLDWCTVNEVIRKP